MKGYARGFSIALVVCLTGGCSSSFNYAGLGNLRRFAQDQGEKAAYLRRQEVLFARLTGDIEQKRLKTGLSKETVRARYGRPFREEKTESTDNESYLAYHHPTEFLGSPVYYLYFDAHDELLRWEGGFP